jgi:DNA-binding MarR family transcriptional regulator
MAGARAVLLAIHRGASMPLRPSAQNPRISYLIGRLHRVLRRKLDEGIRAHGLTVAQYAALSILGQQPGLSNAQLARRSFMSAQSANQVLQRLQEEGLVSRALDPEHGRISRTELTARGHRVLGACERVVDTVEAEMLRPIARTQRGRLIEDLRTCLRMLDRWYGG